MMNEPPSVMPEERTVLQEPEPSQCPEGLFLLVAVFSAPGNSLARRTIRRTWGGRLREYPGVRLIFLLGRDRKPAVHVNIWILLQITNIPTCFWRI